MASKTIFIEHRVGCDLANASSVVLGSEDGTFGIKDMTNDTVIAPNGTATQNPSIGRYQTALDVDNDNIYLVSWRIVTDSTTDAVYKVQKIGPFTKNKGIDASTDHRGAFRQGTVGNLQLRITDINGNAQNATSISIEVVSEGGTSLFVDTPERIRDGFYVYDWEIDADRAAGKYYVLWTYVVEGQTNVESQNIVISTNAANSAFFSGPQFIMRNSLEQYLTCSMHIPVFHEQARPSIDNKTFQFTKGQWNQTAGMRIYRNQRVANEDVSINYNKGAVTFNCDLLPQDVVAADYNFRWYSDQELDQFIFNGISMLNAFPPFSPAFDLNSLITQGTQFIPHVLYGAAIDAMRNLMMCLQFQQPAQFFGGMDRAQEVFSNLETLKQNYEKQWELLLENKKYGPYPNTRLVVTPEFTLPGGRSRWFRYLFAGGSGG